MRSSTDRRIDLNADVGEGPGEEPLYEVITSANIACGGHAGDEGSMRAAVDLALRHGVAVGAHPSYPDRAGFGRSTLNLSPGEVSRAVSEQTAALMRVALELGTHVGHVKPHGALYNDAASRAPLAEAVADGVARCSPALVVVGLAGSPALRIWQARGLRVAAEGFADRLYDGGAGLVPRAHPGALVTDPQAAAAQAVRLAATGHCDTICIHADTPGAIVLARAVRSGLEAAGFAVRAFASRAGSG